MSDAELKLRARERIEDMAQRLQISELDRLLMNHLRTVIGRTLAEQIGPVAMAEGWSAERLMRMAANLYALCLAETEVYLSAEM